MKVCVAGGLALLAMALAACAPQPTPPHTITSTPHPPTLTPPILPTLTATPSPAPTLTPVSTLSPEAISAHNVERLQPVAWPLGHAGRVYGVAVSADGRLVATASLDRLIRVFDGLTGDLIYTLQHHRDSAFCVAFTPDGTRLISGGRDGTLQLWDMATGARLSGARTAGQVYRVAVSPDGMRFASVSLWSASGQVWEVASGAPLFALEGHHTRLRSLAYSQDGKWLATGDHDGVVILSDHADGKPLVTLAGPGGEALALAFSPNGQYLAVGTSLGKIDLWNLEEQSYEGSWFAHTGGVWALVYSADGSLIISAGAEGAIHFWEATTGERLRAILAHNGGVRSIALSLDGATLVSGGDDRRVVVWRVVP